MIQKDQISLDFSDRKLTKFDYFFCLFFGFLLSVSGTFLFKIAVLVWERVNGGSY